MITSSFKYLSKEESNLLLNSIHDLRHKVIALLMLDAGLRVSEATTLRLKNFDFKAQTLRVETLKRKGKTERIIPLSDRLYRELAKFLQTFKDYTSDTPLFSGCKDREFISRQAVFSFIRRYAKKTGLRPFSPHSLRHSFATHHLSHDTSLAEINKMLGHSSFSSTLIYAQVPTEKLKERVRAVSDGKKIRKKWWQRSKKKAIINLDFGEKNFSIGRNLELAKLADNADKGINTIVLGSVGVGKSHLLDSFSTTRKILRFDDVEGFKKSLIQCLLFLHQNNRSSVLNLMWKDFSTPQIEKKIQRENTAQICQLLIQCTDPLEYVLLIDDITRITPSAKNALEKLKDHFVIFCSARFVKVNDTSFLWNFERLDLKPLPRFQAMQFINSCSSGLQISDWEIYRNHIFQQTNGNPRAIAELVDRFRKEPFIDTLRIREIKHTGALPEFDMTWFLVIGLGVLMAMRYMSRELDQEEWRFIGGVAMILLLLMGRSMKFLTKKFL